MNPPALPSADEAVLQERLRLLAIATTVSGATKAIHGLVPDFPLCLPGYRRYLRALHSRTAGQTCGG